MELTQEQINYCMECGVCTGSCPVSRKLPSFSPRQIIKHSLADADNGFLERSELWACLSCARCSVRCPAEIDFPEYNRHFREKALEKGIRTFLLKPLSSAQLAKAVRKVLDGR